MATYGIPTKAIHEQWLALVQPVKEWSATRPLPHLGCILTANGSCRSALYPIPMSSSIPASAYIEPFNPELATTVHPHYALLAPQSMPSCHLRLLLKPINCVPEE